MIIYTLARANRNEVGMILSKYNIPSLNLSQYAIKSRTWGHFVDNNNDNHELCSAPFTTRSIDQRCITVKVLSLHTKHKHIH